MPRKETVVKVINSDSFLTDKRKHPVRLLDVDTPKKGQKGYGDAKKALKELIQGQVVTIYPHARDRNSGSVAKVKLGNKSVNKAMKALEIA
jgi:endonuclease YncB( thermonuclease family)